MFYLYMFFSGAFNTLTWVVISDVFDPDKLIRSLGIQSLSRGFAFIVGPPIARFLFDTFSFDTPFIVAEVLLAFSVICHYFIEVFR